LIDGFNTPGLIIGGALAVRPTPVNAIRKTRLTYDQDSRVVSALRSLLARASMMANRNMGLHMKRVAIYPRVSTSKQDTDNQRRELLAVAARLGWDVVRVYEDAGISGAKGRDKRPGLDAMLKAVNAKEFDMFAAWSVSEGLRKCLLSGVDRK